MFGIGFILIGIVLLLQAAGVFGAISPGIVWGVAFIFVGIMIFARRSMRMKRRQEWVEKHHEKKHAVSSEEKS